MTRSAFGHPMYCVDEGPSMPGGADRPRRCHLLKAACSTSPTISSGTTRVVNLLWHHALRLDIEETQEVPAEDPPQLPSSPDAARRWPAGFPGDHGPDHPGAGHTHRKAFWTPPTSWATSSHSPGFGACSVRRCGCSCGHLRWEAPTSFALGFRRAS